MGLGAPWYGSRMGSDGVTSRGSWRAAIVRGAAFALVAAGPAVATARPDGEPAPGQGAVDEQGAGELPAVGDVRGPWTLTPIPGGFAIDGLAEPTVVHVRAVPGSCAGVAAERGLERGLMPPRGARWASEVRTDADDAALCLEREQDALAVTVHGAVLVADGTSTVRTWNPELRAVLEAWHDAVERSGPPPRWFGLSADRVALPRVGVDLRGTAQHGDGWELDRTPGARYKLVDGGPLGEPDTDLLVPRYPHRLAVGFARGPCPGVEASSAGRSVSGLVPAEVSGVVVDPGPTFHARACVRAPQGEYRVVIRTVDEGAPANDDDVRATIAAFAQSVGVPIAGRPYRLDGAALVAVPLVRTDDGSTRGGVALRARALFQLGRPWSLMAGGELALGAAGDAYHPGEAPPAGPDEDTVDLPGDLLAEARVSVGAGRVLGPVTIDVMTSAVATTYWPDHSWLDVGVGASWWRGRDRLRVRYAVTPLRWSQVIELSAARPPIAVLVRGLDFPTDEPAHADAGGPRRALELAIGVTY